MWNYITKDEYHVWYPSAGDPSWTCHAEHDVQGKAHAFGSQYPFHFPSNASFVNITDCPTAQYQNKKCELWYTKLMAKTKNYGLPYHAYWFVLDAGAYKIPVRSVLNLEWSSSIIPLCLDYSDTVVNPPDHVFDVPPLAKPKCHPNIARSQLLIEERQQKLSKMSKFQQIKQYFSSLML